MDDQLIPCLHNIIKLTIESVLMTGLKKFSYCCSRFEFAVAENYITKADGYDETEWYFPELGHLYFCPFCGTNIKGNGFGKFDEQNYSRKKKKGE